LVIEKLVKAAIVKETLQYAPFSHDLRRLSKESNIRFEEKHYAWFDTITTFNLNARYDSYKQAFYKKCTYGFATEWINNIKEIRSWIRERL
jgi:HEPN domain-containing protein